MLGALKERTTGFLRWSERYTKVDMVYLTHGGFWLTFGQVLTVLMAFGLALLFANFVPKEIYGTYKFVLAWVGIFGILTLPGLNIAIVRAVAQGKEGVLQRSVKTKLMWGLSAAFFALCFASYYFLKDNTLLAGSFLIVSLFIPHFHATQLYSSFLNGKKLFKLKSFYQIVANVGATIPLAIVLLLTNDLWLILATYFASWTLMYWLLLKATFARFQPNDEDDPSTYVYGKHLSLMEVLGTVARQLDKLLLFHVLGAVEVAVYSFAIAPITQVQGLQKGLYTLALPKLAMRTQEEIRQTLLKRTLLLVLLSSPIGVLYIFAAPYIFELLFPAYMEAVWYSQLYALALFFSTASTLASAAMDAHKEIKYKYIVKIFGNGSRILFMLVGLPFGITGMMIGILISTFLSTLLTIWLTLKPWETPAQAN